MELEVVFLCDGKAQCNESSECYKNGSDCCHSFDVSHARHFQYVDTQNGVRKYMEMP